MTIQQRLSKLLKQVDFRVAAPHVAGGPAGPTLRCDQGFTLIEMMIVVAIIGLIGALVGVNVIKRLDEARVESTKTQIRSLGTILDDFKRVCGRYPTTAQGLDALNKRENAPECKNWDEFIKGKLPQDAWGKDFTYESDASRYEIKSLGADGQAGGEGSAQDISSSEL